jgi:hypothetical protein
VVVPAGFFDRQDEGAEALVDLGAVATLLRSAERDVRAGNFRGTTTGRSTVPSSRASTAP